MLFKRNQLDKLKDYVDSKQDKGILKWWAQYQESIGNIHESIEYYKKADDKLNLVRLYCFTGMMPEAISLIQSSNDVAGAYHIARFCEEQGNVIF